MSTRYRINRRDFLSTTGKAALGITAGAFGMPLGSASAQGKFPEREVTWMIYQAPGGSIDTTARIIQPFLEKAGVRTKLEYVTGAGGRVARTKLYTARPDGYAMMTESAPGGAIGEVVYGAQYKTTEFIPIFGWNVVGWQLCVKKDSPIRTFAQLMDECKKRRVVIGSIGRGGSSHIQLIAIQKDLGIKFDMAHFDGSGKAYPAVLGGHVDAVMSGPGSGSRQKANLHFLCVTGAEREKALADVPTLKEMGHNVTSIDQIWYAHTAPKVPMDRIKILEAGFKKAFEDKALWERMEKAGEFLKLLTSAEIQKIVASQFAVIEKYKSELT